MSSYYPCKSALASLLAFAFFCSTVLAVDPPPDGGYPIQNTAEGETALFSVTISGKNNTAIGFQALYNTTSGNENAGVGSQVLLSNTSGGGNSCLGAYALSSNTTGGSNVAVGEQALAGNTTDSANVAVGWNALVLNHGSNNVAVGNNVMASSTGAVFNTAVGNVALAFNTAGMHNVALGDGAMNQSSGSFNVAVGQSAGLNFRGNNNIAVGQFAGQNVTTGANNIDIGNQGLSGDSNNIRIGTPGTQTMTYIAGIRGVGLGGLQPVGVNAQGQLGVRGSSTRFKEAIKPIGEQSEAILSLKPVSFRYKKELDPSGDAQFGLVAEDVAKVAPELVVRDEQGKPLSVRYEEVNAMLLNEFLKEHRNNQEQQAMIEHQQKQIEALTTGLQKVSAQLELIKPATKAALNNQ